jgi:hypothetical protein
MKKLFLPVLFAAVACAQTPAAPQVEPAPDTVIATID